MQGPFDSVSASRSEALTPLRACPEHAEGMTVGGGSGTAKGKVRYYITGPREEKPITSLAIEVGKQL